jgi:chromosome segregation ATPase
MMTKLVKAHRDRVLDKEASRIKDLEHKLDTLDLTHRETLMVSEAREAEISNLNDNIEELKDECNTFHVRMGQMEVIMHHVKCVFYR